LDAPVLKFGWHRDVLHREEGSFVVLLLTAGKIRKGAAILPR
jgi:hypothetical protein